MTRVLLLGGTSEASRMALALAAAGVEAVFSYAGRTETPGPQPLPRRIGGFGGVAGLAEYLAREKITHVIDATHPFAVQMSRNAAAACGTAQIPLIALERPPWQAGPEDRWTIVPDTAGAVAALAGPARRVFLAIGRQTLDAFAARPQHHYLVRLVDPPTDPLPLPHVEVVVARGPFDLAGDLALLGHHRTQLVVAKNAGGSGASAKIAAARRLGLPVVMIDRPEPAARRVAAQVDEVMGWLHHTARLGA